MKRRRRIPRAGLALLSALLACGPNDRAPEAGGAATRSAATRSGFAARGILYGTTGENGRHREIEVDAVGILPGRISGLRVPLLDGLVLEGVRVAEDGVVVQRIPRLEIGAFVSALRRRRYAESQPEAVALADALANVVGRRPEPRTAPR